MDITDNQRHKDRIVYREKLWGCFFSFKGDHTNHCQPLQNHLDYKQINMTCSCWQLDLPSKIHCVPATQSAI